MSSFHADLKYQDVPPACSEGFPRLCLYSHECQRCSRDKHIPKPYSSANNMDPGPVQPKPQVSLKSSLLCSNVRKYIVCVHAHTLIEVNDVIVITICCVLYYCLH